MDPSNISTKRFVSRLLFLPLFSATALIMGVVGCGRSEVTDEPLAAGAMPRDSSAGQIPVAAPSPTEIVSQFLDRVRRGGEDPDANALLTKLAQQEMTRIGRPLQFPGSPDTRFEVESAYPVPNQEYTAWVPTVLSEPTENGQEIRYEVVWTVRRESEGWRISGFTMDQGAGLEPMEIDFENGSEMDARLSDLAEPAAVNR